MSNLADRVSNLLMDAPVIGKGLVKRKVVFTFYVVSYAALILLFLLGPLVFA